MITCNTEMMAIGHCANGNTGLACFLNCKFNRLITGRKCETIIGVD
jgi:hypothetical protein